MYNTSASEISIAGEISWSTFLNRGLFGPVEGSPASVCVALADALRQREHFVSDDLLDGLLRERCADSELTTCSQVIVLETTTGWVIAHFSGSAIYLPSQTPPEGRPARVRAVEAICFTARGPRREPIGRGIGRLHRRIAAALPDALEVSGERIRIYLERTVRANPAADLHRFLVRVDDGDVRVTVDRRRFPRK